MHFARKCDAGKVLVACSSVERQVQVNVANELPARLAKMLELNRTLRRCLDNQIACVYESGPMSFGKHSHTRGTTRHQGRRPAPCQLKEALHRQHRTTAHEQPQPLESSGSVGAPPQPRHPRKTFLEGKEIATVAVRRQSSV